jgi:hypothetical protein
MRDSEGQNTARWYEIAFVLSTDQAPRRCTLNRARNPRYLLEILVFGAPGIREGNAPMRSFRPPHDCRKWGL